MCLADDSSGVCIGCVRSMGVGVAVSGGWGRGQKAFVFCCDIICIMDLVYPV